ncbi:hypothetical protein OP862_09400 [Yersinia massiliensis]|uniref:Uncharacterized protein n=1 Tax=Yersinia massiliensis TaxID=419257 RepID=A0AA91BIT1_9GAMM|nr:MULTISPECIES: hypothetical protein [Yersinia]MDA5546723.1 hypothetical protein [Yersinia massiliensis]NIL26228.1 hypothetical protein [Yersinia massiliensis]UZM80806.1 hypothetical protein OP862_09400 [Yersinia massiliensis]
MAAIPLHPYSLPAAQHRSHNSGLANKQQQNQVSSDTANYQYLLAATT